MGKAVVAEAAVSAGLHIVPASFGSPEESGSVQAGGKQIQFLGYDDREKSFVSIADEYPNRIVVDYYCCQRGSAFCDGTTNGDRDRLQNLCCYISPNGKTATEIMAEQFPGAFVGYSLQVMESHQTCRKISLELLRLILFFEKLGVSFDMNQIQLICDPKLQVEMVGVPEEHLAGHAFHMYHLTSPDAEGTVDAVLFLAKKIQSKADKRIYNMIDILREGNMR